MKVYLSTDNDPANLVAEPIINSTSWSQHRSGMLMYERNRSTYKTLVKDLYYYMEVHHTEGGGGDHLSVGVEVPHDGGNFPNQVYQVQRIFIEPEEFRGEQQTLYIATPPSGYKIRFYYILEKTDEVLWPTDTPTAKLSTTEVKALIESMGTGTVTVSY